MHCTYFNMIIGKEINTYTAGHCVKPPQAKFSHTTELDIAAVNTPLGSLISEHKYFNLATEGDRNSANTLYCYDVHKNWIEQKVAIDFLPAAYFFQVSGPFCNKPGNSGSPVFIKTKDGKYAVVGIISGGSLKGEES